MRHDHSSTRNRPPPNLQVTFSSLPLRVNYLTKPPPPVTRLSPTPTRLTVLYSRRGGTLEDEFQLYPSSLSRSDSISCPNHAHAAVDHQSPDSITQPAHKQVLINTDRSFNNPSCSLSRSLAHSLARSDLHSRFMRPHSYQALRLSVPNQGTQK